MAGVGCCVGNAPLLDRAMTTDENGHWYRQHIVCDFCGGQTRGLMDKERNAVVCDACGGELRPLDWDNIRQERSQNTLLRLQRKSLEMKKKHLKQLQKEVEYLENILTATSSPK